jgi:hypothetical protein
MLERLISTQIEDEDLARKACLLNVMVVAGRGDHSGWWRDGFDPGRAESGVRT